MRQPSHPGEPGSAEEPGEQSDRRLQLLIDSIRDHAIFMLDPKGHVISWNAGAERVKGYRAEEILGRHFSAFYPPEDVSNGECEALLERAEMEGRAETEGWRLRRNGTRFWASVVISAIRDSGGVLVGFAKVSRDLTERRQTELGLRGEDRLRLMIESVRDYAIFMLDSAGNVASWNAAAQRIKGWTAGEIIGHHFSRFYPEDQIRSGKCEYELEAAQRDGRFEDEDWRLRKDGSRFWANVVITPLRDESGDLLGFCKVTRDLTERRRAEQERLELAQSQEAVRLREEFLSIASHELRTPLTALQLQLEALQTMPNLDAKLKSKLERAARSGERLADLISMLLDVSRIATGKIVPDPSRFDLLDAVNDVVDNLAEASRNANCEITVVGKPGLVGDWDRVRIDQVVTNVLANAFKYAAGSPVEIVLVREGNTALLEIRDRGPGLGDADRVAIFGRFQRAASMRNYGGLGLGLFVTREIVEAHGGSVEARNLPERGACFSVRLPLAEK